MFWVFFSITLALFIVIVFVIHICFSRSVSHSICQYYLSFMLYSQWFVTGYWWIEWFECGTLFVPCLFYYFCLYITAYPKRSRKNRRLKWKRSACNVCMYGMAWHEIHFCIYFVGRQMCMMSAIPCLFYISLMSVGILSFFITIHVSSMILKAFLLFTWFWHLHSISFRWQVGS